MTLHSLMMSQANFFLQFKSVVNKSAELKIVTWPKSNFRLTWAPKVGLGPPQLGGLGAAATSLLSVDIRIKRLSCCITPITAYECE